MASVYSEVTAESASGFTRDRLLEKLFDADQDLPYSLDDIVISHNDFAISDVINNSIKKLYDNYLFLIANAEITTKSSPTTGDLGFISFDYYDHRSSSPALTSTLVTHLCSDYAVGTNSVKTKFNPASGTGTGTLSGTKDTLLVKRNDVDEFLLFNYSPQDHVISEFKTNLKKNSFKTILNDRLVEFNKEFEFIDVVSVQTKDNFLFVLDKGLNTLFKFDITGIITKDPAVKRDLNDDNPLPGRFLVKTLGGDGSSLIKNRLKNPESISIYKNKIYILDNGHSSLKVFDLEFNFIHEFKSHFVFRNNKIGRPISIVVDEMSNTDTLPKGYILTDIGTILPYNVINNNIDTPIYPFSLYDTRVNTLSAYKEFNKFSKIVNCKSSKNIFYVCTNKSIYKYYKTNLFKPLTVFNLSAANITIADNNLSAQKILSFDTALHDNVDYMAVTTTTVSACTASMYNNSSTLSSADYKTATYLIADDNVSTKLYNTSFYTNYFSLSDIVILPQEIVNNITFNKTFKKLIYNHFSLFENLNKKIYSYYSDLRIPTLSTIAPHTFDLPDSFSINDNFYIGVNEPLITDIVNRPIKKIYEQQKDIFNAIKEEYTNNNPPKDIPEVLAGRSEIKRENLISFDTSSTTVAAGNRVTITLNRDNDDYDNACSVLYYTLTGEGAINEGGVDYVPALTSDFSFYENNSDEGQVIFQPGEVSDTILLETTEFYSGQPKYFNVFIKRESNCFIKHSNFSHTIKIEPIGSLYTIGLSATNPTTVQEGTLSTFAVTRTRTSDSTLNDFTLSAACNIECIARDILSTEFSPNIPNATSYQIVSSVEEDFGGSNRTISQQQSAFFIKDTSTIVFNPGVSSIVFDISAANNQAEDIDDGSLTFKITNPSNNAIIDSSKEIQEVLINQEYKSINLYLSSVSAQFVAGIKNNATTTSTTMVSNVNVWAALSANSTYQTYSATNPFDVTFTIPRKTTFTEPMTVFSVSTTEPAITFDPTTDDLVYATNKINIVVEGNVGEGGLAVGEDAAIFGKGGRGGHGAVWLSGFDFGSSADSNTTVWSDWPAVAPAAVHSSTTRGLSAELHAGEDGGPCIGNFDSYFSSITLTCNGSAFGGAGGGAGGILGVSAQNMYAVSALSAGCGGGGGAGIHFWNVGFGGLAAVSASSSDDNTLVQDANYTHIHLNNGGTSMAGTFHATNQWLVDLANVGGSAEGVGGIGGPLTYTGTSPSPASYTATFAPITGSHNVNVSFYHHMTGHPGGSFGMDGVGVAEGSFDISGSVGTGGSFSSVDSEYKTLIGGSAGLIIDSKNVTVTAGTGLVLGRQPD